MRSVLAEAHTLKMSRAEQLAALPKEQRNAILSQFSSGQLDLLNCDWDFFARPAQKIPSDPFVIWLILAGRGFGKTRTGAETIIEWQNPSKQTSSPLTVKGFTNFALIGQTTADVRDVMLEGDSGILTVSPFYNKPRYIASRRVVEWPNGAQAHLYSGDEPDQLRGPQHMKGWLDELVKFKYAQATWDMFEFGLRLGQNPQAVVTTTPKPTKLLKSIVADSDTLVTRGSSYDNMGNLSPQFIKRIIKKYEGTKLGEQELYGEILDDYEGALWTIANIEEHRISHAPSCERVVVAIDPAVTNKDESDETGIVVGGRDKYKRAFVTEDLSGKYDVEEWARIVVDAYRKNRADAIVAEVNNGGDLITAVIKNIDSTINVETVWATRDKYTRATPASAMYKQGRVHHVGVFNELETELTEWMPGEKSPNRLDACVWLITDLLLGEEEKKGKIIPITRPF